MPARSKSQQRFMGMVLARKRGKRVGSARVAKAAASMTTEQVKEFASTKRKGLPKKKKTAKQHYTNFLKKSK